MEAYKEFVFHEDCPKTKLFPEMVDLIHKCKEKKYFLAVVSSDLSTTLLPEIEEFGLGGVFDEIITDVDNKLESVKHIIADNNLDLQNTYFVGDSNHEIEVSKAVGINSIAVTWGFLSEAKLRANNPNYVVNGVSDLEKIIL